jgi:2-polyprenyl-6-methoxyphenol hydroxylase-like FAD-dependent oxidoreductase
MLDVLIVGAGPVGLYLGALLLQQGHAVRILEQRPTRSAHTRAIGIHPPALAALDLIGVGEPLCAEGVHIHSGIARSGGRPVASLSFAAASARHPYVLALPQARTETLLEQRVAHLDPQALRRGVQVRRMADDGAAVRVATSEGELQARILVAADGARSTVRDFMGVNVRHRRYPDTYLMGDFAESTGDGDQAVLYLEPGGIVESFPLPGNIRRWVVHTDALVHEPTAAGLAELLRERTGMRVDGGTNSMLSAFSVRAGLAGRMVSGRSALIGDAAHEISPIGGQGMNLGWLDACALAPLIGRALGGRPTGHELLQWERQRLRAAWRAARQAELNMALGRPMPATALRLRNTVLGTLAGMPPAQRLIARRFTMQ